MFEYSFFKANSSEPSQTFELVGCRRNYISNYRSHMPSFSYSFFHSRYYIILSIWLASFFFLEDVQHDLLSMTHISNISVCRFEILLTWFAVYGSATQDDCNIDFGTVLL